MRKHSFLLLIPLICMLISCAGITKMTSSRQCYLRRFSIGNYQNEQIRTYRFNENVRIHINAPSPRSYDPDKPIRLIIFALPNGNTIEQTIGKKLNPGDDWHFGIQHIGAQVRYLRKQIEDQNIVIAYLEAKSKSWPRWRKNTADSGKEIETIIQSVTQHFSGHPYSIILTGHSGGGSFTFGLLNQVEKIPTHIDTIAFLDSNYGFQSSQKHGAKLREWLNQSQGNRLVVIAYDDREITWEGKKVVGPTGGTYRATHRMLKDFAKDYPLETFETAPIDYYYSKNRQCHMLIHRNPGNEILHTRLVGEMSGLIYAVCAGTIYENKKTVFNGPVRYKSCIQKKQDQFYNGEEQ